MQTAIVLTTIYVPKALKSYIDNCRQFNHKDIIFIVVGDLKTPKACLSYLSTLKQSGYKFVYLGLQEQNKWLKNFKGLKDFLPFNSIQRRNIGYLYAAQLGAEVIISIDDDNFVLPGIDYIKAHQRAGSIQNVTAFSSSSKWINFCSYLKTSPQHTFYHRGFPLTKRWVPSKISTSLQKKRVIVNVGFWTGDPDVDTITRYEEPFQVTGLKMPSSDISLNKGTWHPFNSQNTAFYKDALPCFFLITLGRINSRLTIDNFRYDDIWMSYLLKKAADKMNDQIIFGHPLVHQKRNPHDYLKDLERELLPSVMTPKLMVMLDDISLSGSTYSNLYAELATKLEDNQLGKKILSPVEKQCLTRMVKGMRIWLKACEAVK
ncbi:MAG: hypothetical protein HQL22_04890 [Candidatus Omnitrophica bacterium]|nr:hypothetical protein [Candidatus Omnitrophota bacterium]